MSIANKVNFLRGWPNPHIVEKVADADTGVTTLEAGMCGHQSLTTGNWILGVPAITKPGYVFHNDQADLDAGPISSTPVLYQSVKWGGVHGIALDQPVIFETIQFNTTASDSSTVALTKGIEVAGGTDGLFHPAITGNVVIGVVDAASHQYQGLNYLTIKTVAPRVK